MLPARLIGHDGKEYKYLWAEDRVTGLGLQACSSAAGAQDCSQQADYTEAAASDHCAARRGLSESRLQTNSEYCVRCACCYLTGHAKALWFALSSLAGFDGVQRS
jgi:hypothetical protein